MKEKDIFKEESFNEKIRSHTPDILFAIMMFVVFMAISQSRKQGAIDAPQETKTTNVINITDSINQNIR